MTWGSAPAVTIQSTAGTTIHPSPRCRFHGTTDCATTDVTFSKKVLCKSADKGVLIHPQRFSLKCMGFKLMFDIGVKNHHWEYHFLHPPKINMEPKNGILEEEIQSLEIIIFRFHVNFRRCTSTSYYNFWFSFGMFRDILLMVQTSS